MKVLNEKYILKQAARDLIPEEVQRRHKQPYRAPDGASFLARGPGTEYVEEMLSADQVRKSGVFSPRAVESLFNKFRKGRAIGVRDNMALVGILSTQLVVLQFIQHLEHRDETRVAQVHP
jgi:asparagine synthase (glutamine-hydrolysing)